MANSGGYRAAVDQRVVLIGFNDRRVAAEHGRGQGLAGFARRHGRVARSGQASAGGDQPGEFLLVFDGIEQG